MTDARPRRPLTVTKAETPDGPRLRVEMPRLPGGRRRSLRVGGAVFLFAIPACAALMHGSGLIGLGAAVIGALAGLLATGLYVWWMHVATTIVEIDAAAIYTRSLPTLRGARWIAVDGLTGAIVRSRRASIGRRDVLVTRPGGYHRVAAGINPRLAERLARLINDHLGFERPAATPLPGPKRGWRRSHNWGIRYASLRSHPGLTRTHDSASDRERRITWLPRSRRKRE